MIVAPLFCEVSSLRRVGFRPTRNRFLFGDAVETLWKYLPPSQNDPALRAPPGVRILDIRSLWGPDYDT